MGRDRLQDIREQQALKRCVPKKKHACFAITVTECPHVQSPPDLIKQMEHVFVKYISNPFIYGVEESLNNNPQKTKPFLVRIFTDTQRRKKQVFQKSQKIIFL